MLSSPLPSSTFKLTNIRLSKLRDTAQLSGGCCAACYIPAIISPGCLQPLTWEPCYPTRHRASATDLSASSSGADTPHRPQVKALKLLTMPSFPFFMLMLCSASSRRLALTSSLTLGSKLQKQSARAELCLDAPTLICITVPTILTWHICRRIISMPLLFFFSTLPNFTGQDSKLLLRAHRMARSVQRCGLSTVCQRQS